MRLEVKGYAQTTIECEQAIRESEGEPPLPLDERGSRMWLVLPETSRACEELGWVLSDLSNVEDYEDERLRPKDPEGAAMARHAAKGLATLSNKVHRHAEKLGFREDRWSSSPRENGYLPEGFEGFGFEVDEQPQPRTPEFVARTKFEAEVGGGLSQLISLQDLLRDPKVSAPVGYGASYVQDRAWFVYVPQATKKQAIQTGKRIQRQLRGRRNLRSHQVDLKPYDLYVGYGDGLLTLVGSVA